MIKIIIIVDYKDSIYSVWDHNKGLNKRVFSDYLKQEGFWVEYKRLCEINFREKIDADAYYIYQSSEDPNLKYKFYVEDIIYGLEQQGAKLIPPYKYLKAHHNKIFMEILRDITDEHTIKNISSLKFGVLEELEWHIAQIGISYPIIFKTSSSCGSRHIFLASDNNELLFNAKIHSASPSYITLRQHLMRKIRPITKVIKKVLKIQNRQKLPLLLIPNSENREKFILQNFISELDHDFKILVFFDKIYALKRLVRDNDFRASGSGKFQFLDEVKSALLDYAISLRKKFDVPFISLDVAEKNSEFYLLEFQFLMFGTYTIERSKSYFKIIDGKWKRIAEIPDLEREYANSLAKYIKGKESAKSYEK